MWKKKKTTTTTTPGDAVAIIHFQSNLLYIAYIERRGRRGRRRRPCPAVPLWRKEREEQFEFTRILDLAPGTVSPISDATATVDLAHIQTQLDLWYYIHTHIPYIYTYLFENPFKTCAGQFFVAVISYWLFATAGRNNSPHVHVRRDTRKECNTQRAAFSCQNAISYVRSLGENCVLFLPFRPFFHHLHFWHV